MVKRLDKRIKKTSLRKGKTKRKKVILAGSLIVNDRNHLLLLHRKKHDHYETPGGKIKLKKGESINEETLWTNAYRNLIEELGNNVEVINYNYFTHANFQIPDGRIGVMHKFLVNISGEPIINEPKLFSKLEWIHLDELEQFNLSPDLKLMLGKIKQLKE